MVNNNSSLENDIEKIIDLAQFAPSVHNTQPWKISTSGNVVSVAIDKNYQLGDGDPTGRQTFISLGIFIEAIALAATKYGFISGKLWLDNNGGHVELKKSTTMKPSKEIIGALTSRVTDRSVYSRVDIKDKQIKRLLASASDTNARVWAITDANKINKIADLTSKGIGVALSNPSFRKELGQYLVNPWSKRKRGISTSSLYIPKPIAVSEPLLMKYGIGKNAEVNLEKRRWQSASGVILITTQGDMPKYWFEAGRAYLQVALEIEQLGFSQATSAATVEASNYHEDVEQMLGTSQRLQCVLRIGKGADKRNHSPRVPASDLIT